MILIKWAHQSVKFQTFNCSGGTSPNLSFCFFCWKYINFQLKRYRGVMFHYTEAWCKIWRKTNFFVSKMPKIWWILIQALKSLKICTLIGPFCKKYITFGLKKYRGVIFHDTEESCKVWKKIDLWFGKWHEEFSKFSSEHLKVSKLVLSWDPFVQSRKCMSFNLQRSYV